MMKLNYKKATVLLFSGLLLFSCNNSSDQQSLDESALDPNSSLNTNFDGKIFSIPSPIQMTILLKELKLMYNEGLLNKPENEKKYNTEFLQALNLGVYGTDLGYASFNEQNSTALKFIANVDDLTNKLGLTGAFDKNVIERFQKNHTNKDSVVTIISDAFRKGDNFLKNTKRKKTSALILTGGWIESMNIACNLYNTNPNEKLKIRIAEQQQTLNTIIEVLTEYNDHNTNDSLISNLSDLKTAFDKVEVDYQFVAPKTDSKNKTTTLQHKTTIKVDAKVMTEINEKVNITRKNITLN